MQINLNIFFLRRLNSTKNFSQQRLCQLYRLSDFLSILFDNFGIVVISVILVRQFGKGYLSGTKAQKGFFILYIGRIF